MSHCITLKELCTKLGISRRTIQGYEKKGLVAASGKNKYGHLLYDEKAQERIREIRLYQQLGFKLREINAVMNDTSPRRGEQMKEKIFALKEEKKKIEELIEQADTLIQNMEKRKENEKGNHQ